MSNSTAKVKSEKNWSRRQAFVMIASLGILIFGSGSRCPGTSSTSKFESSSATTSGSVSRAWRTAQFIDIQEADATDTYQNNVSSNLSLLGLASRYSMSVYSPSAEVFRVVMTRGVDSNAPNADAVNTYAFEPTGWSAGRLVTGLGNFTLLDSSTGTDAERPITATDSSGNSISIVTTPRAAYAPRPLAMQRQVNSGAWSAAVDLSSSSVSSAGAGATNPTKVDAVAVASDSLSNFAVVWCQGAKMYFNQYRPGSGWRFTPSSTSDNSFDDDGLGGGTVACNTAATAGRGAAIAFDNSGNGYAAYATASDSISIRRWSASVAASFTGASQSLAAASTDAYPKLHLNSDGSGFALFYRNYDLVSGTAELYLSTVLSSSTVFSAPVSLESFTGSAGVGATVSIIDSVGSTDTLEPIVSSSGNNAAVGFIKTNGVNNRFYVSRYLNGTWNSPIAVDDGAGDVTWASVAINSNGQIAATYVVNIAATEYVYGAIYSSGNWSSPQRLDGLSTLVQSASPGRYRPSVAIDSSGNAFVVFSMNDSSGSRRAVGASYR